MIVASQDVPALALGLLSPSRSPYTKDYPVFKPLWDILGQLVAVLDMYEGNISMVSNGLQLHVVLVLCSPVPCSSVL